MSIKQSFTYLFWWITNLVLGILRLKKRNPNIWLFGAWRGQHYSDNPKYLFEYVCTHFPEIEAVWITKNEVVKNQLIKEGKPCFLADEKRGRQLRIAAGFVFFANGAHDFGTFDLCQGSTKVALWHGMPLKKIFFASNYFKQRNRLFPYLQYLVLKTYHKAIRDITIATSEKAKEFMRASFELSPERVFITGQPRNDVLFDRKVKAKVRRTLALEEDEQFVLYMPTWRETGDYDTYFDSEASFLDNVLKQLKQDSTFLKSLEMKQVKLYVKPHPNRTLYFKNQQHIGIIEHSFPLDTQELLTAADVLITDYSSAFIDFALTEKPIHFFVPDLEAYKKGSNGLFLEFEEIADFWFDELEDFKKAVLNDRRCAELGRANARKVNRVYNDPDLKKGQYAAHVMRVINHCKKL